MNATGAMADALDADARVQSLAYVDLRSGLILAAAVRDEQSRESLDYAVQAAAYLCAAPRLASMGDDPTREAMVVSERGIHVFSFSRRYPDRVVVGGAAGDANVALLLASVRSLAEQLVG